MLDQLCVAGSQQFRSQVFVLSELRTDGVQHQSVLDALPVAPEREFARPAHVGSLSRRFAQAHRFFVLGAVKLHRLEEVLARRPALPLEEDRVAREIRETTVLPSRRIEVDYCDRKL